MNHREFFTPTSPFSNKPIPVLEKNQQVLWLLWPKTHVCMVVDWYYTTWTSTLVHCQGSQSLGGDSKFNQVSVALTTAQHTLLTIWPSPRSITGYLLKWGLAGGKWQGWSRNISMISIPGFMNLLNKLMLTLEVHNTGLQPNTHVFWPKTATNLVNFPQKWGLVWQKNSEANSMSLNV